jgi:hypothetical protein
MTLRAQCAEAIINSLAARGDTGMLALELQVRVTDMGYTFATYAKARAELRHRQVIALHCPGRGLWYWYLCHSNVSKDPTRPQG